MAEVMNRSARRAAGMKHAKTLAVNVRNQITVVPMEHIETYFAHGIASEGRWAVNTPLFILQPNIDRGRASDDWFARTVDRMRETRRRKETLPMKVSISEGQEVEIDIGGLA